MKKLQNEKKVAEQGDVVAQYNLGWCYRRGEGVEKNNEEAVKWYRKAAKQGYEEAQYELGGCYANGIGVKRNEKKVTKWYQKAVKRGEFSYEDVFLLILRSLGLIDHIRFQIIFDEKFE